MVDRNALLAGRFNVEIVAQVVDRRTILVHWSGMRVDVSRHYYRHAWHVIITGFSLVGNSNIIFVGSQ